MQGDLELSVTMINVNYGHNVELMKKCQALNGYSLYISKFREYTEENGIVREEAARKAIEYCIDNDVMVDFFEERRKEVVGIMLEVTEEIIQDLIRDLEDDKEELAQRLEAEFKEHQVKMQQLQAKIRENEEKNQEIEKYKQILKDNGIEV